MSRSGDNISIEGINDVLMMYQNASTDMAKAALKAVKESSRNVEKEIKAGAPKKWAKLVKTTAKMTRQGKVFGRVGFRNRQGLASGKEIPEWFKAYWMNYGTLSHRDPEHRFDYGIKPDHHAAAQRRRNRSGQPRVNFFDKAVDGWERRFLDEFKASLKRQGYPVD